MVYGLEKFRGYFEDNTNQNVGESVGENVGENVGQKMLKLNDSQKSTISLIKRDKHITPIRDK